MRLAMARGWWARPCRPGAPCSPTTWPPTPGTSRRCRHARELVVPLRRKGHVMGALNLLSRNLGDSPGRSGNAAQLRGAVAVAIENARLFESERRYSDTMDTMAEIGREFASILDLDELLKRIAHHIKRLIDYRTFGILLVHEETGEIEMRHAVRYTETILTKKVKKGEAGGYAAEHRCRARGRCLHRPPLHQGVEDARSELVMPLLVKDRCVGCSTSRARDRGVHEEAHRAATPLAASAAVAIDNGGCTTSCAATRRLEREVRFAQRVQQALLPTELPKRLKGVDVDALRAGARAGRRLLRLPRARAYTLTWPWGRVARACRQRSTRRLPGSSSGRARTGAGTPKCARGRPTSSNR